MTCERCTHPYPDVQRWLDELELAESDFREALLSVRDVTSDPLAREIVEQALAKHPKELLGVFSNEQRARSEIRKPYAATVSAVRDDYVDSAAIKGASEVQNMQGSDANVNVLRASPDL
jgi:hypothetical protein